MVGALAWQATVIKEDIFVSWGWRSHGGLFFWPRVLLPRGVPCPYVHWSLRGLRSQLTYTLRISASNTEIYNKNKHGATTRFLRYNR